MANNMRQTGGKFAPKSDAPRKVRSVNLTDAAWEWLARTAERANLTRNDYLEALARGGQPFMEMEMVGTDAPFMEMEENSVQPFMEMEMVGTDAPFMEMEENSVQPFMEMDCQCQPDAADLLNRLKARNKKSKASLSDVEAILAMLEE
jgi:hypothetical protein